MEKNKELNGRPKMKILENAYNEIISTIGSRPAESGGLLFGKEDDMIVRKFVFDKHARTTRSTYTFNTDFLNPEIKRIWNDEGLSCIGFIHSHPHGYGRLSPPDVAYFSSMFECMPRKHYITPIVFTVPDGGFKLNAHILPNQSSETINADVEVLPDDYLFKSENSLSDVFSVKPKAKSWSRKKKVMLIAALYFGLITSILVYPLIVQHNIKNTQADIIRNEYQITDRMKSIEKEIANKSSVPTLEITQAEANKPNLKGDGIKSMKNSMDAKPSEKKSKKKTDWLVGGAISKDSITSINHQETNPTSVVDSCK
jgi:proteasome lid subunit RPN8/RPN11